MIKNTLIISLVSPLLLALTTVVHAVTVDIYITTESGSNGEVLTPQIMEGSTIGGIAGLPAPDWLLVNNMWVSTDFVRPLPGKVTVDGIDYTGLGTRTWKFSDLYKWNFVDIRYGEDREKVHPPPYHTKKTVACFYTPNPDQFYGFGCTFDNIIIPVYNSYAVLQTIGEATDGQSYPGKIFMRAHGSKIVNGKWVGTVADTCILADPGKTYWVNLHHDGPTGVCKVAVFDPDDGYAQLGGISISECNPWDGYGAESRVAFGRADNHSDLDEWWDETFSYFSHIMIDYTEGKFPLLPDNVPIKNFDDEQNTLTPKITVYPNPSGRNVIIQVRNTSPALIAGSKLKIYDLSGRLVDELTSRNGKFVWDNSSISAGTYLLRLEGTGNYLSQRILLMR
jgi:hypothetical protein